MGVDPTVSQSEIGSATQKSKGTGGVVSVVSYSRPSLMITQWPKSVDESDFVGTACNSCFSDQNM